MIKRREEFSAGAQIENFAPLRVLQIELSQPLPDIAADDEKTGKRYKRALCIVLIHNHPLGFVELQLCDAITYAHEYAPSIWAALHVQLNEHLQRDELPTVSSLKEVCKKSFLTPSCVEEREQFYAHAPFISIVVCTHDRTETLSKCLDSLLQLQYPKYEIILVDNAPSTHATAKLVQGDYGGVERLRYVRENQPGLSRARNCGVRAAKGEIIAFTDDDVVVDKYWLLELVRCFRASNVVCVTGLVLPLEQETLAQYTFEKYGGLGKGFSKKTFDASNVHTHLYRAGRLGAGANMAFTSSFLYSIGGFDPALGAGSPTRSAEETAVFLQVLLHNYSLVYTPSAMVHHLHRREYRALCMQVYNYGVGFTAYLIKGIQENPWLLSGLLSNILASLFAGVFAQSRLEEKRVSHSLQMLTRFGREGMIYGIFAYLHSQWSVSHRDTLPSSIQRVQSVSEIDYKPVRVTEIELGQPLFPLSTLHEKTGYRYQKLRCLVRLHGQPLGCVEFRTDENEIQTSEVAHHIWRMLGTEINQHLEQDGLAGITALAECGLPPSVFAQCMEECDKFLVEAPFVSIIVATHDRLESLQACIASLLSINYPHYEILIVDNASSTTATSDFVRQNYAKRVRYLREERPGASWARNRGIKAARGEFIAFVDDDVVVDRQWLVELVKAFSSVEHVGCVTSLVLPMELESSAQEWFEEYGGFNKGFTRQIFDMKLYHPKTPLHPYTAGRFGTGAGVAFRASFLHEVGGFDPALGPGSIAQGGEDLALFFQVMQRGYRLVYEPTSLLYHLHRRDYADLRKQIYCYGVGLTAYLTQILVHNPLLLLDFLFRVPFGVFFAFNAHSTRNSKKSKMYPPELTMLERKGMLYGPIAYLRSRSIATKVHREQKHSNQDWACSEEVGMVSW